MTKERHLWKWLSKARHVFKKDLHMTRIENSVSGGMPDVEGHLKPEGQFWLELKVGSIPKRGGPVRLKVRPRQVGWHDRRWKVGGNNYFLVQVGSGAKRRLFLFAGNDGALLQKGLTLVQMHRHALWSGDAKSKPQDAITACLLP